RGSRRADERGARLDGAARALPAPRRSALDRGVRSVRMARTEPPVPPHPIRCGRGRAGNRRVRGAALVPALSAILNGRAPEPGPRCSKLDALHARFRDHTLALFERHGMTGVGYFKPQDAPLKQNTLIYILAHPSREAATKNWQAFHDDP